MGTPSCHIVHIDSLELKALPEEGVSDQLGNLFGGDFRDPCLQLLVVEHAICCHRELLLGIDNGDHHPIVPRCLVSDTRDEQELSGAGQSQLGALALVANVLLVPLV